MPCFLQARLPTFAPVLDITIWEHMKIYQLFDQEAAEEVMNSILHQPWYLTQKCVILALFNGTLQDEIKAETSLTLQRAQRPAQLRPRKPSFPVQMLKQGDVSLSSFVGRNSWLLL